MQETLTIFDQSLYETTRLKLIYEEKIKTFNF